MKKRARILCGRKPPKKLNFNLCDTSTPFAMTGLLVARARNQLLSASHSALLQTIMRRRATGKERTSKFLSPDTVLAHKTGSAGECGYSYAQDVGIVTLPASQGHIAITIFTASDQSVTIEEQEAAIAEAARLV